MKPAKFVPYAEWSRRSRGATPSSHPIGATEGVTFHWEGPHMGSFPHNSCADKVRGIQAFHRDTRKWADIAYSGLVCPHGYVFEGRGVHTTSAANGSTTANGGWYALCYLGGQGDPFTDEAKQGFVEGVQWLRSEGGAGPRVNGHRDHKATECPGATIYAWLQTADFDPPRPAPPTRETYGGQADAILEDAIKWRNSQRRGTRRRRVARQIIDAIRSLPSWRVPK